MVNLMIEWGKFMSKKLKVLLPKEEFEDFKAKLKANDGYCLCKVDRNADTRCMCWEFLHNGICECEVYGWR